MTLFEDNYEELEGFEGYMPVYCVVCTDDLRAAGCAECPWGLRLDVKGV